MASAGADSGARAGRPLRRRGAPAGRDGERAPSSQAVATGLRKPDEVAAAYLGAVPVRDMAAAIAAPYCERDRRRRSCRGGATPRSITGGARGAGDRCRGRGRQKTGDSAGTGRDLRTLPSRVPADEVGASADAHAADVEAGGGPAGGAPAEATTPVLPAVRRCRAGGHCVLPPVRSPLADGRATGRRRVRRNSRRWRRRRHCRETSARHRSALRCTVALQRAVLRRAVRPTASGPVPGRRAERHGGRRSRQGPNRT